MLKQIEFVEKDMTDSDFKISNLGTLIFMLFQCYFGGGGMRNYIFLHSFPNKKPQRTYFE